MPQANLTDYIRVSNELAGDTAWPQNQIRYYTYSSTLTIDQAKANFLALSPSEQIAATSTSVPATVANYQWVGVFYTGTPGFDYSYTFSRPGHDFAGNSFVTTPAPVLVPLAKTKPRLKGNNYALVPQPALNTALFKRIPKFTPHSSKILIYPGGLYTDPGDNDLIGRGFTHVSESTKFSASVYPTQYKRAIEMANYKAAYDAAMSLADGDARKQKLLDWAGPLPAFEGSHVFIDDEATCQLYAHYWYLLFKQADWIGGGIEYFSVNHESYVARDPSAYRYDQQWYRQVGWLTKAIIAEAAADGNANLKSGLTDFGNLSCVSPENFEDIDSTTQYPRYLSYDTILEPYRGSSESDPIGSNSDMAVLMKAGKAFTGVGRYMNYTNDGQSLFEKNTDGSLKVVNGELVWRTDKRSANLYGQASVIYAGDNLKAMVQIYGFEASDYANWFFRAGSVHLPMSNARRTGYESIRFSGQYRLDTQVLDGLNPATYGMSNDEFLMLNNRPIYAPWAEANAIRMYEQEDYVRGWMETQLQTDIGADNGKLSKSRATVEQYAKGFQRAAEFNWIFDTPMQLGEPKLWIRSTGTNSPFVAAEAFYRKPIIRFRIGTYQSHPTIYVRGYWPCQDEDHVTDVLMWVDTGTQHSPSYLFQLDGRNTFLEAWTLPDNVAGAEPKHVYFQFHTLLGELVTWKGDYREAVLTSNPTPQTQAI